MRIWRPRGNGRRGAPSPPSASGENGDSRYLVTETPIEFLNAAHLLRLCLQDGYADATAYARRIPGGCASSREQFEKVLQARLDNTGRAAGVF